MTKEEIIEQLENSILLIKQNGKDWFDDRDIPILEACINALAEPCEDCVSRKEVDKLCWEYLRANTDDNIAFYEHFVDLPSMTPKQEPKVKVLDFDEVARKLGTVDVYKASGWATLLNDLEYLGLKICEAEE